MRNLKTIGGRLDIRSGFGRIYQDCGFTRLEALGTKFLGGGSIDIYAGVAGELDLNSVKKVNHIRVRDSDLTVVTLPSDVTLEFGQLVVREQPLPGQRARLLQRDDRARLNPVKDTYSGLFQDNAQLPDCHARRLNQILLDAGSDPNWVLSEGNLVCLDK